MQITESQASILRSVSYILFVIGLCMKSMVGINIGMILALLSMIMTIVLYKKQNDTKDNERQLTKKTLIFRIVIFAIYLAMYVCCFLYL